MIQWCPGGAAAAAAAAVDRPACIVKHTARWEMDDKVWWMTKRKLVMVGMEFNGM